MCVSLFYTHMFTRILTHPHTHTHTNMLHAWNGICHEVMRSNAVLLWSWLFSLPHTACLSLCHHVSLFLSLSPSLRVSRSVSLSHAHACTFSSHSVTLSHFLCVSLSVPVSLYLVCCLSLSPSIPCAVCLSLSTSLYLSVSVCLSLSLSRYLSRLLFSYCSLLLPFSLSLGLISLCLYRSVCVSLSFSLTLSTW